MKKLFNSREASSNSNSVRSQKLLNISVLIGAVILGGHTLIAILMPYDSVYPISPALAVLWLYFLAFSISAQLSIRLCVVKGDPLRGVSDDWELARKFAVFLVLVSLVGLGFHVWAKLFLLQINPVECISHYRFAWLTASRDSLPPQIRIASVLGHLLTSFSYLGLVGVTFNIVRGKVLGERDRQSQALQMIFMFVGVAYSLYIGSRNSMLTFWVMALIGAILGLAYSMASFRSLKNWRHLSFAILLPTVVSVLFAAIQFSNRIYCREGDALTQSKLTYEFDAGTVRGYMLGYQAEFGLTELGDKAEASYRRLLLEHCSICAPAMVYINHGVLNLGRVVGNELRGSPVFFQFLGSWMTRILPSEMHMSAQAVSRVYGPGGLTLAGAAYHDFGLSGVLILAVIMGLSFGASIKLLFGNGFGAMFGLCCFVCLFYVQTISNMFNGFGVISFPFIAFGSCAGLLLNFILKRFFMRG